MRRVGVEHAVDAVTILREAAAWALGKGIEVWRPEELREHDFAEGARRGELVMGFERGQAVVTMLLQPADSIYWPEVIPGSTLFLHKIAVRRAHAGRGWLPRMVDFAAAEALARGICWLRLDTLHESPLRGLYEQLGFSAVREPPLMIHGRPMIRMERTLCR